MAMRWLAFSLALAALTPACSTKPPGSVNDRPGSGGNGSLGEPGINTGNGGRGNGINTGDGMGRPVISGATLTAEGGNPIVVTGAATDVQLNATLSDGSPVKNGIWTTDDTQLGSVGEGGVFHANGFVGGEVL